MSQVVNICHGWMCPLVTKCQKSDFNVPTPLVGWDAQMGRRAGCRR